jgi:hypothetical protein
MTHKDRRAAAAMTKGAAPCAAQGSPARGASQRARRVKVTHEGIEPAEATLVEGGGALEAALAEKAASHHAGTVLRGCFQGWRAWAREHGLRRKELEEHKAREVAERAREERLHLAMELGAKLQGAWAKKAVAKVGLSGGALKHVHAELKPSRLLQGARSERSDVRYTKRICLRSRSGVRLHLQRLKL